MHFVSMIVSISLFKGRGSDKGREREREREKTKINETREKTSVSSFVPENVKHTEREGKTAGHKHKHYPVANNSMNTT